MADYRMVQTRIWRDAWFTELETDAKLLFIYLFTNERASVCGMYELPLKFVSFETGIAADRVQELLEQFAAAGKVYYKDGVFWVANLRDYNESKSPKVRQRIAADIAAIPDGEIKRMYCEHYGIGYAYSMDALSGAKNTVFSDADTLSEVDGRNRYRNRNNTDTDTDTDTETDTDTVPPPPNLFQLYETEIGPLTPMIAERLIAAEEDYPPEWVASAIQEAVEHNARNWKYVEAILANWRANGFKSKRQEKRERFTVYYNASGEAVNERGERVTPDGYLLEAP